MSFKIIPEDAGNTLDVVEQQLLRQDHPRRCREHAVECREPFVRCGSSPRMQGAPRPPLSPCLVEGIIPADAGSTGGRGFTGGLSRDHPHGCGEHLGEDGQGASA